MIKDEHEVYLCIRNQIFEGRIEVDSFINMKRLSGCRLFLHEARRTRPFRYLIDDPRDVGAMAEKIGRLLTDSQLLRCLGHHAGALSRALEVNALRYDPIVDVIEGIGRNEHRTHAIGQ